MTARKVPAGSLRVNITLLFDVDIEGWANEYGIEPTAYAVGRDVRQYFNAYALIPEHLRAIVKVP